jgi:hypothetical protein
MAYAVQTEVQLKATFTNRQTLQPIDPTTVTLTLTDPSGNQTVITVGGSGIVRQSTGVYYYNWIGDVAGAWTVRWQGTGAAVASNIPYTITLV